jgi:hypothetical protein
MSLTGFKAPIWKSIDIQNGPDLLFTERVCMRTLTQTSDQFISSLLENDPKLISTKALIARFIAEWPSLVKAFVDLIASKSRN